MKMKRILQVVSCLELGGTEAFIMNNYRMLDRTKYQFDFLVFVKKDYPYLNEIKSLGGRIFFCGLPTWQNFIGFLYQTRKIIKKQGPYTAIHSHVNIYNWFPILVGYLCRIPVRISHSHAVFGKETKGYKRIIDQIKTKIINRYSTHYLACSENAGEYLYGDELFKQQGIVINNGIDVEKFLSIDANESMKHKKEMGISKDEQPIVGNITRFEKMKNSLFTIDVFSCLLKYYPEAVLIMGGPDGGLLEECRQAAKQRGLENKVLFIGPRNDIPECINNIDIYLFPSQSEGFGIAALEAQAGKCLCIASTNVPSMVDCGLNSTVFISLEESAEEWAKKIAESYRKWEPQTNEMIKEKFIELGFDIRISHQELLKIYNS